MYKEYLEYEEDSKTLHSESSLFSCQNIAMGRQAPVVGFAYFGLDASGGIDGRHV